LGTDVTAGTLARRATQMPRQIDLNRLCVAQPFSLDDNIEQHVRSGLTVAFRYDSA
jgi:hypothetical protein